MMLSLLIETAVLGLLGGAAGTVVAVAVGTLRASAPPSTSTFRVPVSRDWTTTLVCFHLGGTIEFRIVSN